MEITENLRHLNISIQEKVTPLSRETQNDDQKAISNFASIPISIKDYATIPYLYARGTLPADDGAAIRLYCVPANLLWSLNAHYLLGRSAFRFRLVIRSSFNHTGLVALHYMKRIGCGITSSLFNANLSPDPRPISPWYVWPNTRSFLRLGQDIECEITVPWLSPLPCCRLEDTSTPTDYPFVNFGNSGHFEIFIRNMSTLRTIAGASQTIDYFLYYEPVDVHVGGLRSNYSV